MELIQELNRTKNRIGLVGGSLKINEYDDLEHNISASINPKTWSIEFNLKKGFDPVKDKRQKTYARKKKIQDGNGKRILLEDILHHELAHWELPFNSGYGCPYDIYNHDLILEAIKKTLPSDKQSHASYVADAFEDLLINPRVKEFKGDFSGQVLFWDNEGLYGKEKGQESYTQFYEAFVKLNMHLFGDNVDKILLKRHYSNNKKVEEAVKKVIQELNLQENIKDTSSLFVKEKWSKMASLFAKNISDLLDVSPTERLSVFSQSSEGKEESPSRNGIEQKMYDKEGKEEIAYGRYKNDKSLSPNITSYEQLDSLYKRLARSIPVSVEAMTREQSLDIAPLNFRAFDEDKDDVRKIVSKKLFLTDEGITLGYKNQPITITQKSKVQKRSFPDFKMVILDNSGSMKEGIDGNVGNASYIPWGDNSKYHYALLGFYGIEQFLQAQGISQYIGHGLSLFSSNTRYKETDFNGVQELRRLALSPEFKGTKLDASNLLKSLNGRESFVLSISDGEIDNWDNVKEEFHNLARNNYFGHIQIGNSNQFTQDLESNNFPVFYVNKGQELSKLMVNIANDTYKRFVRK